MEDRPGGGLVELLEVMNEADTVNLVIGQLVREVLKALLAQPLRLAHVAEVPLALQHPVSELAEAARQAIDLRGVTFVCVCVCVCD
jgi:hypothetical protein